MCFIQVYHGGELQQFDTPQELLKDEGGSFYQLMANMSENEQSEIRNMVLGNSTALERMEILGQNLAVLDDKENDKYEQGAYTNKGFSLDE